MVSPEPGVPPPIVGSPSAPDAAGHRAPKARFIVPASILFLLCCLAFPALMGNWHGSLAARVGTVRMAYLFALSQFFIVWIVAALYVRATHIFDRDASAIMDETQKSRANSPVTYPPYSPHSIPAHNQRN